jgi:hypothetical protein
MLPECRALLEALDHQGLLPNANPAQVSVADVIDDEELLARLGVNGAGAADIAELRHVRSAADKRAAEEIANRQRCEDFHRFKPLFLQVQNDIESGIRQPALLNSRPKSGREAGSLSKARKPMSQKWGRYSQMRRGGPMHGCA